MQFVSNFKEEYLQRGLHELFNISQKTCCLDFVKELKVVFILNDENKETIMQQMTVLLNSINFKLNSARLRALSPKKRIKY